MAEQELWRNDNRLTAIMVDDFIHNPILAAKVLLGLKIPPHEELRILVMWTSFYTIDDSGFSTGKSFTFAILSALRSILFPGRVSGILSKTFAQGKLIFRNYDRWYETNRIFKSCITKINGKPRLVHGTDVFAAHFRGGSEIRVLPPNFMQDAERLRSERWNDAYMDEFTTFGKFTAFNSTITGRVTKDNKFPDDPIRQNHIHLASTPSFTHSAAYEIVRNVSKQIQSGNKDYARFSCNYRHIPKTPKWRFLVNRKVIFNMQTTLPIGIVRSEIDGIWQKDSASYYSSAEIQEVRYQTTVAHTQRKGSEIYIAGFDVARGGSSRKMANAFAERGTKQSGDDFSLSIFRIVNQRPYHCYTIRKHKITASQMSGIVHKLDRLFGFTYIVYDPNGGGLFVADEMKKEIQLIEGREEHCHPILEMEDNSGVIGKKTLVAFRRNTFWIERMWGKMASNSVLVNKMHEMFKGAIQHKHVTLAGEWSGWPGIDEFDADSKRLYLVRNIQMSEPGRVLAEMDLAATQLIMVDVERDEDGEPKLDSFGMYKFLSKHKKDSAYGLCYAYVGTLVYKQMILYMKGNKSGGLTTSSSRSFEPELLVPPDEYTRKWRENY